MRIFLSDDAFLFSGGEIVRKWLKISIAAILILFILSGIGITILGSMINADVDYATDEALFSAAKCSNTATYYAYDRSGALVKVSKESSGGAKSWVALNEVSEWLVSGFLAAEDRGFYRHGGINIKRTLAAAINTLIHYTSDFGASTITQQVIKNISGDNERSFRRKATEILRAIHLDMAHEKDEILEVYINVIPMSGNIYGVKEASLTYFNKEPAELTLAESATLVGITNAPSRYDPITCPDACLEKRNRVLYAMLDNGDISEAEYQASVAEPLGAGCYEQRANSTASWFVETAREEIIKDICALYSMSRIAAITLLDSGTKVVLTVDTAIQDCLETFFEDSSNLSCDIERGLCYSMVVCDSKSGDVVGVIGAAGQKNGNRLFNHATAEHPPASTLKPLALYAPLIDSGAINWATLIDDTPVEVRGEGEDIYMYPRNSPDVYEGAISIYDALKASKNTVAARLYEMLDKQEIYNNLKENLGLDGLVEAWRDSNGKLHSDLSLAPLALGQLTKGVSLVDLTHAYTVFPGDGIMRGGRTYYGVFGADGEVIIDNSSKEKVVFKQSTARVMNMLLEGVVYEGTARGVRLKETVDTAAKTGTSSGNRDKLLVGYTPMYTAGIWCGYQDGKTGVYSKDPNHIEVWDEVMRRIHEIPASNLYECFNTEGLKHVHYCRKSGCLATDECIEQGAAEWGFFIPGLMPDAVCPIHSNEE